MSGKLLMRKAGIFGGIYLLAIIALLPIQIALVSVGLVQHGLTAREANGTVWSGSLTDARFGPVPLGHINVGLRFFPLLLGRAALDVRSTKDSTPLEGAAIVSRHAFGVEGLTGRLDVRTVAAPLPIDSLDLKDVKFRFDGRACRDAAGMVVANAGDQEFGLRLSGGLTGDVRCDGDALLLSLASQTGVVHANLRISSGGHVSAELVVNEVEQSVAETLSSLGFRRTDRGFVLRTFRDL